MEVVVPRPSMEFDYNSMPSSPYLSGPSTPKRFENYFFSAPTSPSRMSEFYREFDNFAVTHGSSNRDAIGSSASSSIPFDWEEKPGTPKSSQANNKKHEDKDDDDDFDFAFFVGEEVEKVSLSAEELFDDGKIKPLKPPPRLQVDEFTTPKSPLLSPRSPRSPIAQGRKLIRDAFSPKKKKESDPFATAADTTRNRTENERGRDRTPSTLSSSNSGRRATWSHSPYRISHYSWEEEQQQQEQNTKQPPSLNSKLSLPSSKGSRKWRLRDFLLFRSASEGRATDKDPFRKYSVMYRKSEDVKNSSFRSTDGSNSASNSRRRAPVSAHELHYAKNKAASEDLKKKTFLPYKQRILGNWLSILPSRH
ncbi:AR781, pheromone receptor-like protein [Quillaja saponaria]|uniref:AR781, pheromone receptor-like protein n=1 Tax=Quillaja saponaria TaxID=32244 RepID=A0AAD7PT91_QUISA|nr:AR781, pheromone receptor-like protein [Quillaja saponaria]